jgi:Ca2+-binding RTX toxin-like protein
VLLARLRARGIVRTLAAVLATTLVLGGMIIAESRGDPSPEARAVRAAGALSIANDRADQAALTGRNMLPGDVVRGSVTITNSGENAGLFELSSAALADTPGPGGDRLSDELRLLVEDVAAPPGDPPVYDGTLSGLDVVPLGELGPDTDRTYRFTVVRPAGGTPSSYRAASTQVDFIWTAFREAKGPCAKRIFGSSRADALTGSRRSDTISGGKGDDVITGLTGRDCLDGEAGDDRIDARDGDADRVDCGSGSDTAVLDPLDRATGCEQVSVEQTTR